jgi:hypothetical protein
MRLILAGIAIFAALPAACVASNTKQIAEGQSEPVMAANVDAGALLVRDYPGYCDFQTSVTIPLPVGFSTTYSCSGAVAISDDGSALLLPDDRKFRIVRLAGGEDTVSFDPNPYSSPFIASYRQQRVGGRFVANYTTAIDMRTGAVRRIAQRGAAPQPVYREVSRTPEGAATMHAPRPAHLGAAAGFPQWQTKIIADPNGGEDILLQFGGASVPYADPDLASPVRMRLSDLQPAPPPGPAPSALAPLIEIRDYAKPSAQFNQPYTLGYFGYGEGYGHPFLYSHDGSLALWGLYGGKSGSDLGFGVFGFGSSEPLWTMKFEGAPPSVSISEDNTELTVLDNYDFAKSQGREPMVRTYNARTGALVGEMAVSSLPPTFVRPAPPPMLKLPPPLEPFRVTSARFASEPEYVEQLGVLVAIVGTEDDKGARLVVREDKAGTVVWQKDLEADAPAGRSRRTSFDAADATPRVAVLSTDGKIRIFDYGDALKP